jgi:hypothetical protein
MVITFLKFLKIFMFLPQNLEGTEFYPLFNMCGHGSEKPSQRNLEGTSSI